MNAELRVLAALARGQSRGGTHAERLQAFYAPQAAHYDAFRERLLHGRAELVGALDLRSGMHVVELGAGTGRNAEFAGEARLAELASLTLVDLCPALLDQARARNAHRANVQVVHADATRYRPDRPVDVVFCAYSLSMMPTWRQVLDNALAMLAPGGRLGIVDFHVRRETSGPLARRFWRSWFGHDGVDVAAPIFEAACSRTVEAWTTQGAGKVPYLPGLAVPWRAYIGRVRERG